MSTAPAQRFPPGILLAYAGLVGAMAWVGVTLPGDLALAWSHVLSNDAGATLRFGMGMVALLFALGTLLGALTPKQHQVAMGLTLAMLLLNALDHTLHGGLDPDEIIHLHQSWLFGTGLRPYRDFFQVHQVAWPLLTSLLLRACPDNLQVLVWLRMVNFALVLGMLVAAGLSAKRLGGSVLAGGILAISILDFVTGSTEFRPDSAATLASMGALLAALHGRWGWAGLANGLALLLGQKSIVPCTALLVGLLSTRPAWRTVALYCAAILPPVSLGMIWAATRSLLTDYLRYTYLYSFAFVNKLQGHGATYAVVAFKNALLSNPMIALMALCGCGLLLRQRERPGKLLVTILLTTVGLQLWLNLGYRHYVLFATLLATIVSALCVRMVPARATLAQSAPTFLVLLVGCIGLIRMASTPPAGLNLDRNQVALAHTPTEGRYFGPGVTGVLSHPVFRRDASYYFFARPLQYELLSRLGTAAFHPLDDWQQHPPDVFVELSTPERQTLLATLHEQGLDFTDVGLGVWVRQHK